MTETLAHAFSSESIQQELSYEYQHNRVPDSFQISLHLCALDEISLNIVEGFGMDWLKISLSVPLAIAIIQGS